MYSKVFLFYQIRQNWNVIEKETPTKVFSCEFSEVFKNKFFTEHFRAEYWRAIQ